MMEGSVLRPALLEIVIYATPALDIELHFRSTLGHM